MRSRFFGSAACAVALSSVLLTIPAAWAAEGSPKRPDTVYLRGPQATSASTAAEIVKFAQSQGEIRVIVGLDVALKRGPLSAADAAAQRSSLSGAQNRVALRALGSASVQSVVKFDTIPFVTLKVGADALSRLLRDPEVVSIQVDAPQPPSLSESVPLINADDLVAKGIDGSGRVVAILDTGVASAHPMITGKVVSEACYSTNDSAYTATSVCPGGVTESTAAGSGRDCAADADGCSHGTHVASIAAGNTSSLKGVAPAAKIIAVQVFSRFTSGTYCGSSSPCVLSFNSDQIKGLERVLALSSTLKVDAANMSLGGGSFTSHCDAQDPARKAAIDNLLAAGVATVISSGNNGFTGSIGGPACISSAIAVGATTKSDQISSYSNHSELVDLLAPGSSIRAGIPPAGYAVYNGTSMAAPHVTGAFALLREAEPDASVADILSALSCSGVPLTQRETGASLVAKPRIDVLAAANALGSSGGKSSWSFKKGKDGADWSPIIGSWQVKGGFYQGTAKKGWVAATTSPNCDGSVKVTAEIGRVLPKEKGNYANTGIAIKVKTSATGAISGYYAAYNACPTSSDGVCTGAKGDKPGQLRLFRFDELDLKSDTGIVYLLCQAKGAVKVNRINKIELTSSESTLGFRFNGKTVCSALDGAHVSGGVVAMAYTLSKKSKPLQLDALTLTSSGSSLGETASAAGDIDPKAIAAVRVALDALAGSTASSED